jgi:hypothetical protein
VEKQDNKKAASRVIGKFESFEDRSCRKPLPAQLVDATPSHRNDFSKGGVYGTRKTE